MPNPSDTRTSGSDEATWDDFEWGDLEVEETEGAPEPPSEEHAPEGPAPASSHPFATEPVPPAPTPETEPEPERESPAPAAPQEAVDLDAPTEMWVPAPQVEPVVFTPETAATLTLIVGDQTNTVELRDPFKVGRRKDNDLVIQDLHVSSKHARFVQCTDGAYELYDLDSAGGTFVNGNPITRHKLAEGDRIEFATVGADFHYVAGAQCDFDDDGIGSTLVQSVNSPNPNRNAPKQGRLVSVSGDQSRDIPVKSQIFVGRSPQNEFVIDDGHISNRHARLIDSGGGKFELIDLESTCGTFVNDTQIQKHVLGNGDRLRFGSSECIFEIVDPG